MRPSSRLRLDWFLSWLSVRPSLSSLLFFLSFSARKWTDAFLVVSRVPTCAVFLRKINRRHDSSQRINYFVSVLWRYVRIIDWNCGKFVCRDWIFLMRWNPSRDGGLWIVKTSFRVDWNLPQIQLLLRSKEEEGIIRWSENSIDWNL